MPLPVVAVALYELVGAAVAWVLRNKIVSLVAGEFLARMGDASLSDLLEKARRVALSMISEAIGIELNPDLPIGVALTDAVVRNSGIPIRTLFDRDMVREDLESYALDQLQARSGFRLSSLTNTEKVKDDLAAIGMRLAQDRTGVPLAGVRSADEAREVIVSWAMPLAYDRLLSEVPTDEGLADGDALITQIRQRLGARGDDLSTRQIVRAVHSHILAESVNMLAQAPDVSKVDRRRLQLRWAQKKFRERHGVRQMYVPLGFEVSTKLVGEQANE